MNTPCLLLGYHYRPGLGPGRGEQNAENYEYGERKMQSDLHLKLLAG